MKSLFISLSVAAGFAEFVESIKVKLGKKAKHRRIHRKGNDSSYALHEPVAAYSLDFEGKNGFLRDENRLLWHIFADM